MRASSTLAAPFTLSREEVDRARDVPLGEIDPSVFPRSPGEDAIVVATANRYGITNAAAALAIARARSGDGTVAMARGR